METYISILFFNLKVILLLYDCIKFELYIFCNLGKITTNNISPRISDKQLNHFRQQWRVWIVEKKQHFPTGLRILLFISKSS